MSAKDRVEIRGKESSILPCGSVNEPWAYVRTIGFDKAAGGAQLREKDGGEASSASDRGVGVEPVGQGARRLRTPVNNFEY